jgi:hypothetical protein
MLGRSVFESPPPRIAQSKRAKERDELVMKIVGETISFFHKAGTPIPDAYQGLLRLTLGVISDDKLSKEMLAELRKIIIPLISEFTQNQIEQKYILFKFIEKMMLGLESKIRSSIVQMGKSLPK